MNEISFQGRNIHIRQAGKILQKIDNSFPVICPWKVNRLAGNDGSTIKAPICQEKLDILRDCTKPDFISDYKYASKILEGVKLFKSANCKELSELGYLIAMANNMKNCYCASLYGKISDRSSDLKNFGHVVLLIMKKPAEKPKFSHKYYVDSVHLSDTIIPDNKTIVVDPVWGIVDYWKNAILKYAQTSLNEIVSFKDVRACLRQPLLSSEKDLNKLKKEYPILDFKNKSNKIKKHYSFYKGLQDLKIFKKEHNIKCMNSEDEKETTNNLILNALKSYFM